MTHTELLDFISDSLRWYASLPADEQDAIEFQLMRLLRARRRERLECAVIDLTEGDVE